MPIVSITSVSLLMADRIAHHLSRQAGVRLTAIRHRAQRGNA